MQKNIINYNVLSTLTTGGGDANIVGYDIVITGAIPIDYRGIVGTSGIVTTVAEARQVDIITPTAANSTLYVLQLNQTVSGGVVLNQQFVYTSDAGGTATEICDGFRTAINASNFEIVASGTTTLILTANAGYAKFTSTSSMSVGVLSIATGGSGGSTAGVYAVNTYASLTAAGVVGVSAGKTYTSLQYQWVDLVGTVDKLTDSVVNQWTVYVDDSATNYAAFLVKLQSIVNAVAASPLNGFLADSGQSAAINATATATAAEVATGRITSTSGAAVTITLPTGTLLGAQLGASAGTMFDLIVDNTAGANTVTLAPGVNCIESAWTAQENVGLAPLDVVSGVTGVGVFRFVFSSATDCVFSRVA